MSYILVPCTIVPWYGVGYVTVMPDIYDFIRWYLDEEVDAKTEGSVCGLQVPKYTPGPHRIVDMVEPSNNEPSHHGTDIHNDNDIEIIKHFKY